MRLDKWLWVARFFKTRAMAARACELGRIESNSQRAKPAREVKIGDVLNVRNEAGDFVVEVMGVSDMRGPAAAAQALYRETIASVQARMLATETRKAEVLSGGLTEGRPSKKDRREIGKLRGRL